LPGSICAQNPPISSQAEVCWKPTPAPTNTILLAIAASLPLLTWPGLAQPFSYPKLLLLVTVVVAGAISRPQNFYAAWLNLGQPLRILTAAWPVVQSLAAICGRSASLETFLLPLAGLGWFVLLQSTNLNAKSLARTLQMSATLLAAIAIAQMLHADPFTWLGWTSSTNPQDRLRVFSTLGNPNFVAAYLCGTLPLTLAQIRRQQRALPNIAASIIQLGGIIATGSRAPLLAGVAIASWCAILRDWRLLRWIASAAASALLAASLLPSGRSLETKAEGRAYIWRIAAPHALKHPLLGIGPGGFAEAYTTWEANRFPQIDRSVTDDPFAGPTDHAHNDYLEILIEGGALALASWIALLTALLWRIRNNLRSHVTGIPEGATAGVVAISAIALVDFPLHRPAEVFLLWSLLALCFLHHSQSDAFAPQPIQPKNKSRR
jgi:putative inorganic carbon (hco3(-)) transporter